MSEKSPLVVATPVLGEGTTKVQVTAPATLTAGYTFDAEHNGIPFVVRVPAGGVTEGQVFTTSFSPTVHTAITTGRWIDGLCDCFNHPLTCIMVCCGCSLCVVGQVLTRLKRSWLGFPAVGDEHMVTFRNILILAVVDICVIMLFPGKTYALDPVTKEMVQSNNASDLDDKINRAVSFLSWIYMLYLIVNARFATRTKYGIEEEHCAGCEDVVCAACCPACTICLLARQTGNYKANEASCFSSDGFAV